MTFGKVNKMQYNTTDVFSAAAAAFRHNKGYVSSNVPPTVYDEEKELPIPNKKLIVFFLSGELEITNEDVQVGEKVRELIQGYSFKILKGQTLNDFNKNALRIANQDSIASWYDLAVASYLPKTYFNAIASMQVKDKLDEANGFVGRVTEKVTVNITVLKSFISNEYGCSCVTAITDDNKAIFFTSSSRNFTVGSKFTVIGKVKNHKDNVTRLSYVKIVD